MARHVAGLVVMAALLGCNEAGLSDFGISAGAGDAPSLETPRKTDVIQQTEVPEVDVLWVVDSSCSMAGEQNLLTQNFPVFISWFLDSGLDWHIGVVSTDMEARAASGKLRNWNQQRYLTPDSFEPETAFARMAKVGTNGSATEQGLDAAFTAIAQPTGDVASANDGFYRPGAALHIITISDEDDQSVVPTNEFVQWAQNLKADPDLPVTFSAITGPVPNGCGEWWSITNRNESAEPAPIYHEVVGQLDGEVFNICENDWQPALDALGLRAAGLRDEYFLSELPVPGTITVTVDDEDTLYHGIDIDTKPPRPTVQQVCRVRHDSNLCFLFEYNPRRNSIQLPDFVPNARADILIEYDLLSEQQFSDDDDVIDGEDGAAQER